MKFRRCACCSWVGRACKWLVSLSGRCCRNTRRCCRMLKQRVPWWRVALVATLASLLSAGVPGATLHGFLLSKDSERQRLVAENDLRLEHSLRFLQRYRSGLAHQRQNAHRDHLQPVSQRDELKEVGEGWAREADEREGVEEAVQDRPPDDVDTHDWPRRGYPSAKTADGRPVDVAVTVLTTARGRRLTPETKSATNYSTQYLMQSVARLLDLVQDPGLQRTYSLTICNVDDHPDLSEEVRQLEDLLPVLWRYGNPQSRGDEDTGAEEKFERAEVDGLKTRPEGTQQSRLPPPVIWEKLKADYIYCLEQALASGAPYALLVEDDAVAHAHLFRVVEHVLSRVVEEPAHGPVAYIKLYHPRRLLGYVSLEPERLAELLALSLLTGAILTLLLSARRGRTQQQQQPQQQQKQQHPPDLHEQRTSRSHDRNTHLYHPAGRNMPASRCGEESLFHRPPTHPDCLPPSCGAPVTAWVGWALTAAVLALAVGRANLLEARRLSPQLYQVSPAPSCCIPAVLYTQAGGRSFSRFLANVTCTASRSTDIRMDEWREGLDDGSRGLMIQPSLFSHIGLVSSLRTSEVDPLIVQ